VVDLFAVARLNHHTQLESGVLADACGQVLREFFAERREQFRQRRAVAGQGAADATGPAPDDDSDDTGDADAPIPAGETVVVVELPIPHPGGG
jgi:tRNA(adenine34) deaminase